MSELPKGWTLTTIGNIGKWCSGGTPSRKIASYFGGKIPWIKSGDLPDGIITKVDEFITDEALKNSAAKLLPSGTISIALYGATIGKLGIVSFPSATNQACANCVVHPEVIEKRFLYFYLLSQRKAFIDKGQGGAQPNISQEILKAHPIPLAPLKEQHRIVSKFDELLPKVDACKQRLEKIPTILKRFRQSVLAAAVSGKLTEEWRSNQGIASRIADELPSTWASNKVAEVICDLKYGTSVKCSYEKLGVPVLRIPNVVSGEVDLTDLKYGVLEDKEQKSLQLEKGDILLIRSNGSVTIVGRTALVKESAVGKAYAGYLIRLRPNQKVILPEYLQLSFCTSEMRDQIEIPARSTSGVNNINSEEVRSLNLSVPPLDEQKEIIRRVETEFAKLELLYAKIEKARAYTQKVGDSVLGRAFRGELVDQDPTDEPASKLIERLKFSAVEKPKKAAPKKRKSDKAEQSLSA